MRRLLRTNLNSGLKSNCYQILKSLLLLSSITRLFMDAIPKR
ncbi:unnamed protein product, partial [Medioppia subpectinata]